MNNKITTAMFSMIRVATVALLGGAFTVGTVNAQQSLFKSDLSPTGLGSAPRIGGVPADPFAWQSAGTKTSIGANGDLTVKAGDLLILDTDGADPGLVGTNGGLDFFASLVCGGSVAGNSAPVTPSPSGKVEIAETDFLNSVGVTACPGAQILLRVDTGSPTTGLSKMYAVAGGGQFTGGGDGRLFTVDPDDSLSVLADLSADRGLSGVAFDSNGRLFVTTNRLGSSGITSGFHEVDPDTGDILSGVELAAVVRDLAFQPGSDVLYGVTGSFDGNTPGTLVTLDTGTGALTVVKDDGPNITGGGLAFAPDGTLYRGARDFTVANGRRLEVLDPDTGDILSHVQTDDLIIGNLFLDGLGVSPEGLILGTNARERLTVAVDPVTGGLTRVLNFGERLSDVDFRLAPWVAASGFSAP